MRIAHVALWTSDLERAATFWTAHFDADIGERYASARRPGFVSRFLRLKQGAVIELMSAPWLTGDGGQGEERCGWAHIALALGSQATVDDLAARMKNQGLLESGPRWTGDGYYEAVVRDPDGNLIEITV